MEELRSCPFCGEEAFCGHDAQGWAVLCPSMQCDVSPTTTYHDSEEQAIAAWNTRADSALAERMRVLEEALRTMLNQVNPCERMRGTENYACHWCYAFGPDPKRCYHSADCAYNNARALLAQPAQSGDTDTQADASEEGR